MLRVLSYVLRVDKDVVQVHYAEGVDNIGQCAINVGLKRRRGVSKAK